MNKARLLSLLRLLVTAGLLFWLYRRVDPARIRELFAQARLAPLAAVFALLFFNTAISALKWKILLKADGSDIPWRRLTATYLVGTFFNIFLPSNIGGDAYRIYDVARHSGRTAHSFASVLADRISGFVALVALGFFFGVLGIRHLPEPRVFIVPGLAMAALVVAIVLLFEQRIARRVLGLSLLDRLGKLRDFGNGLLESVAQYRRAPGLFARIMSLSFLFQFAAIACVYLLACALNLGIPFVYFCVFVPFISLIEALPVSIYGLGIRDATYVYFFTRVGVDRVHALSLALAYVLVTLLYSLSGGIIFAMRPGRKT
jgi:glycosyltransferase 2 family protein